MELTFTNEDLTLQSKHFFNIKNIKINDINTNISNIQKATYIRFVDNNTRACKVLKDREAISDIWLNENLSQSNWALNLNDYLNHSIIEPMLKMLELKDDFNKLNVKTSKLNYYLLMKDGFTSIETALPNNIEIITLKDWCIRNQMVYHLPYEYYLMIENDAAFSIINKRVFSNLVKKMNKYLGTKLSENIEDNKLYVKTCFLFKRKEKSSETIKRVADYALILATRLIEPKYKKTLELSEFINK